jgi:DUF3102 family protein
VRPAEDLQALAARIRAKHEAAEQSARTSLESARQAGEDLILAKKLCGHGNWLRWLKENVKISEVTARRYMRVARELGKSVNVTDLTMTDVLRRLAQQRDKAPDAAPAAGAVPAETQEAPAAASVIADDLLGLQGDCPIVGRWLRDVRQQLEPARFEEWLRTEFGWDVASADLFIRLYEESDDKDRPEQWATWDEVWSVLKRLPAITLPPEEAAGRRG